MMPRAVGLLVTVLTVCAIAALSGCGLAEDREAAAVYADRYFAAAAQDDLSAVLGLYSQRFFSVTPRETWMGTLTQVRDRCGRPQTHKLENWAVTRNVGTNAGTTVRLVYEVHYARCRMTETLTLLRPPAGGFGIFAHSFRMNESAAAGAPNTTTT
jgi:hypothetical protein